MLTQQTVTHLRTLRLDGMARAFEEQLTQPLASGLAFEDRFGLLVDRELAWRDTRRLERLLKQAKLKYPDACIEDLDTRSARGLDPRQLASLAGADWIRSAHNVLITGATGLGKTWLACALGQAACRQGFVVLYTRFSRLLEELRIAHGDGSFSRRLQQLARTDLLILDDWGLAPIGQPERTDLLEMLDDRTTGKATLITSQLPVEHWHAYLNDPTLADAILDRIVHGSHRLMLKGESLRKNRKRIEKMMNANFCTAASPTASRQHEAKSNALAPNRSYPMPSTLRASACRASWLPHCGASALENRKPTTMMTDCANI